MSDDGDAVILQRRGAGDAAIVRIEVRAERADPLAARLAVERMLGAIDLRPDSLPPSGILCVRELRDPRPGTLSLSSNRLRPSPAWEQAVRGEVDRLARAAVRPAHGAVPVTAEAVVFSDESELLACLGSDLVAHAVATRWWWRLLVEPIEQPRRAAVRAWLRSPEHVPAALQTLAERRQAEAFVRLFDDHDARDLAAGIAMAFGVQTVAATVDPLRRPPSVDLPRAPAHARAASRPVTSEAAAVAPLGPADPMAPWSAFAPEADRTALSVEQRVLLGIALTVARAPSLARSPRFTAELLAWRAEATSSPRKPVVAEPDRAFRIAPAQPAMATASSIARAHEEPGMPAAHTTAPDRAASLVAGDPVPAATRGAMAEILWEPAALPPAIGGPGALPPPSASEPEAPWTDAATPAAPPAMADDVAAAAEAPRWSPATPRKQPATRPRSRAFGPPIRTQLGGVFYLVNLALYLQLYGDEDHLSLSPWDFVALIGRALLGDAAIADDPVWALLAELAGRPDAERPGAGFAPPAEWRLPPAWLAPFEATALVRASAGRLVISHPDGFAIVDVETRGDPALQLAAELAPYGVAGVSIEAAEPALPGVAGAANGAAPHTPPVPLDRWLARLLPYLRARLRRVLGVDDAALLLAHPARVHVTDTHLDIVLLLETLPIEIRIAGLDRDPGWVATAGRFIAFHFE